LSKEHAFGAGFYTVLGGLFRSGSGWIFWLVVSKLASTSEVGFAATMLSLVILVSGLLTFGFEFGMLKDTARSSKLFYTLMVFEMLVHAAAIPILYLVGTSLYETNLGNLIPIAILIFILHGFNFVTRNILWGKLQARIVFIWDIIAIGARFGMLGLLFELDAYGVMLAFAIQYIITGVVGFWVLKSRYRLIKPEFEILRSQVRSSFSNIPTKYTRLLRNFFTIILVAAIVSNPVEVAAFYMAMLTFMTMVGISRHFFSMSLPASQKYKQDLFSDSFRLGLGLVVPLIAVIVSAPHFFLEIINPEYVIATNSLILLCFAVIPAALLNNTIYKLNLKNDNMTLIKMGLVEVLTLISLMFVLTYAYGMVGAAISILISVCAPIPLILKKIERQQIKAIVLCTSFVVIAFIIGLLIESYEEIKIIIVGALSLGFVYLFRILRKDDLSLMFKGLSR